MIRAELEQELRKLKHEASLTKHKEILSMLVKWVPSSIFNNASFMGIKLP